MANHYSALKRARTDERRTLVNRMRKTRLRHQIRTFRKALASKDATSIQALLPATYSMVDRAAKWGIIKKNTAARYKSRLTARVKALAAPAA
jgi:small subunit ribosomal protein S20